MSDQRSPDSIKLGSWLFRWRTLLPLPIALAIVLIPPGETSPSSAEILVGVVLTIAGEALRVWGVQHIGVISRTRSDRLGPLVDSGPFAYVRNPLYIGNILIWVGFAVTAGLLWLAPIVLGLLAAEYHGIVEWEESLLASRLGEAYSAYCRRVPRWIPTMRGTGRAPRGVGTPAAPTAATLFSERGTLIAISAGYLLLWLKARF